MKGGPAKAQLLRGNADPANPQYFMTKRGAGYYLQK